MYDGELPCQQYKMTDQAEACRRKIPPYPELAWPRPPPKITTFENELVNMRISSSTHRIEYAIDWIAPKTIPFDNRWKLGRGPLQYAARPENEGEFWINSQVQERVPAISSVDETRIMEHMVKDKRILPLLAGRHVDPIPFFVRFVAKREWQAQEATKSSSS